MSPSTYSFNNIIFPKAILLIFFIAIHCQDARSQRPNIIYITADDLGYADLSCYGRKDYITPNLDKLASQGIKFTNAYAAAPICTPSRTAFMTGRYPARTPVGLYEPLRASLKDSVVGLDEGETSVAALLKKAGYQTALVGKWHLGLSPQHSPNKNGFDDFFGFLAGAMDYVSHNRSGSPSLFENANLVEKPGYSTDLFADRAVQYIRGTHEKPFFLSVQFNAPHWPWQAPGDKAIADSIKTGPAQLAGGSPATFAAMIRSLDNAVGKIVDAVDESKLSRNTLIIFTSDNGGEKFSDMGIFTGLKGDVWEGGIRVPAFIRWPGRIQAGSSTDQAAITMDWTATILAAAGAKPATGYKLDGEDLIPVCTSKQKAWARTFFWRVSQGKQQQAVRHNNWKYLQDKNGEYLFDLSKDPGEKNDIKLQFSSQLEALKKKYKEWEQAVLKPIPL